MANAIRYVDDAESSVRLTCEHCVQFQNNTYDSDGYLIKTVSIKTLDWLNVRCCAHDCDAVCDGVYIGTTDTR